MGERAQGSATLVVIILLAGLVFAAANLAVLVMSLTGSFEMPPLAALYNTCPPCLIYYVAAPLIVSILVAIMVRQLVRSTRQGPPAAETTDDAAPAGPPSAAPALRLLGLLQEEGRLVDFLAEDIDGYEDAQVGAAVRSIHAGCRKALQDRVELRRIYADEEGSEVVIEPGFDPAAVRLTGNVSGAPPFRGTLQHGGWRAAKVTLPQATGAVDATIIAPAEVEIP